MRVPILVAGFGRCGSSLVMQMLYAAGVRCLGEYPDFEPEVVNPVGRNVSALLRDLSGGSAAKILDPQRDLWPDSFDAKIIWLNRSAREQAKSQVKFLRIMAGIDLPGQTWRKLAASYAKDFPVARERFLDRCKQSSLIVCFEDLLTPRSRVIEQMAGFVGLDASAAPVMRAQVIERSAFCQSGLDIEAALIRRGVA